MSELGTRSLPLALLALAALGLLVWLPRRVVRSPAWALFRSLVPAWRFFEQIEPVPVLQFRVAAGSDDWSEWQNALTAPARTPSSLLLNAAGNLHLAQQSLIEHFVCDLEERAEPETAVDELVSYRLICALVEQRVVEALSWRPGRRYQFRLVEAEPEGATVFSSSVFGAE